MGKSAKISRSGMQGFTKQKKLAKNSGLTKPTPPPKRDARPGSKAKAFKPKPKLPQLPN